VKARRISAVGVSISALCLAVACDDPLSPGAGIREVAIDTSAGPISRTVSVHLESPGPVEVTYGASGTPVLTLTADSVSEHHRLLLPRLRAQREYLIEVATPGNTPLRLTFRTGALPPEIAEIQFHTTGQPSLPVSIVEVVAATRFSGLLIVEDGEVVGHMPVIGSLFGTTRRANGDIVLVDPVRGLVSRRLDGSIVHRLPQPDSAPGAAYGRIHHDVTTTPGNTLLFIANETQPVEGEFIVGEALWEWNPEAGTVARRWSAFDHLDWQTERGARSTAANWLHGNGVSFGPRGNILLSLRNVDQVISISPDFSMVEWKLGGVNGTLAVGQEDRFLGQHYVSEPSLNRVLIYDNGFNRPGGSYTRAIEYRIDMGTATAARVWQYRHTPDIYAALVGSAIRLPNGNTSVLFGMSQGEMASTGPLTAVEVNPAGAVQWRMTVGPQLSRLYRVTPVASLLGERAGAFRGR
jgi:hypothetical protein